MTAPATSYLSDADTIEAAVYQALGAASVCWDSMEGTGVFHSDEAKAIAEELLARIRAESVVAHD